MSFLDVPDYFYHSIPLQFFFLNSFRRSSVLHALSSKHPLLYLIHYAYIILAFFAVFWLSFTTHSHQRSHFYSIQSSIILPLSTLCLTNLHQGLYQYSIDDGYLGFNGRFHFVPNLRLKHLHLYKFIKLLRSSAGGAAHWPRYLK